MNETKTQLFAKMTRRLSGAGVDVSHFVGSGTRLSEGIEVTSIADMNDEELFQYRSVLGATMKTANRLMDHQAMVDEAVEVMGEMNKRGLLAGKGC